MKEGEAGLNKLTIVMYHYVRELKNSKYPEIKGLDIFLFVEQIKYIKKHYYPVSMEEVIESIENDSELPPKAILLTFDDAYLDHYINVFPILDRFKVQGSFYPPAKAIFKNIVLDVNKIHFILASVHDKTIIIKDIEDLINRYKEDYKLSSIQCYYKKLAKANRMDTKDVIFIKRFLQVALEEKLRLKMVDELFVKYVGMSESAFSRELYMNQEQLGHMRRSGMHIGSHGYNHYWWNRLEKHELEQELELSLEFLGKIGVEKDNWTACYPYGGYDDQSIKMLREKGCRLAVTTDVDIATANIKNRFLMARLDTNDIPKDRNSRTNKWYLMG
jgi:peptidoglycan/xylan/chitin deacetylase (PgdA/CDA1 family)